MRNLVILLALISSSTLASAQSCDPKSILIQDKNISINDDTTRLSILDQIDKEHFEEAKKSWQSGGSVIIEGLPISGYGNYEDFSSARDREKRNYRFDLNQKKISVVVHQSLSDAALQAYVACLQFGKDTGVFIWPSNTGAFAKKAIINVKWLGGVGGKSGKLEDKQFDGVTISGEKLKAIPNDWRDKEVVTLIVTRQPDEDAIINIKISGYSETLYIPRDPPQVTASESWVTTREVGLGTDRDDKSDWACLDAGAGEYFVFSPASPSITKTVQGNDDPGHNKAILRQPPHPKRLCMDVWTHTSKEGTTQSIKATMTALKRTITVK